MRLLITASLGTGHPAMLSHQPTKCLSTKFGAHVVGASATRPLFHPIISEARDRISFVIRNFELQFAENIEFFSRSIN